MLSVARESLKPNPELAGTRGAGRAGSTGHYRETGALQLLARYALTPEATAAYSSEGNAIHYNVEAARAGGFRAPIIGGGQGVHLITAALCGKWHRSDGRFDIF